MLKISKLADYATTCMRVLAYHEQTCLSAAQLAVETPLSVATVSKVLKRLNEAQLVTSVRGAKGGYCLAHQPQFISVADIVTAIDGRPAMTECGQLSTTCQHDQVCQVRGHWQLINGAVFSVLNSVSLADLIKPLNDIQLPNKTAVCQSHCQHQLAKGQHG